MNSDLLEINGKRDPMLKEPDDYVRLCPTCGTHRDYAEFVSYYDQVLCVECARDQLFRCDVCNELSWKTAEDVLDGKCWVCKRSAKKTEVL